MDVAEREVEAVADMAADGTREFSLLPNSRTGLDRSLSSALLSPSHHS